MNSPAPTPYPWDGFVIGPENALAHAGVLALARGEPGLSPLVVHGPAGAGKSRLLKGLVAEHLARHAGAAVAHLSAEAFDAYCTEAVSAPGGWGELRDHLRAVDLLVVDDLHGLERSPMALSELSSTLDALDSAGAWIAVSARTGPGQWSGWPSRLVDRLVGGLSVRVDPPGPESRRRHLLDRTRTLRLSLTAEAVEALAEAADGYRTLDGWLQRLALASRLDRRPIDRALAESVLSEDPIPTNSGTIAEITRAVADRFGVRVRDLRSADRHPGLVAPRHLAIYLARELTGASFAALGHSFGRRDPATIRHACRKSGERLANDPALAAVAEALRHRWRQTRANNIPKNET
ncbi:hypothetical protein BH23PLA1_BH23PLA1_14020 [soil metagenome]